MNLPDRNFQDDEPPRQRGTLEEMAADWIARRDRGFLAGEQEAFSAWLRADPRHAAATASVEHSLRFLLKPRQSGQSEDVLRRIEARVTARGRRRLVLSLSACGLVAVALFVFAYFPRTSIESAAMVVHEGMQIKPDRRTLSDGSSVELDSTAEIVVEYTTLRRNVRLLGGTALFAVAKDPGRPFFVIVGNISVQAVGTEFCVRTDSKEVNVLVTEGRVAVDCREMLGGVETPPPTVVNAGHDVSVLTEISTDAPRVRSTPPQAARAALAWRALRVEFTDISLREAVRVFNQRNPLKLEVDASVGDLRISGVFWLDDPEGFSRLVETSAGLKATRASSQKIRLQ